MPANQNETDGRSPDACPEGAPTHRWVIAHADIAGRGSATTRVVEVCESCHAIRIDTDVEVVGQ